MEFADIVKVGAWIIASLGGAGVIILGLSNFFGGLFAKRYEEKMRAKFQREIDKYQSQLDLIKETTLRYSNKQFELYSKLWTSLYDLKLLGDDLWERATASKLVKFSKQLKETKNEIERASLFIEDEHYTELIGILSRFSEYQIGKEKLIDYRRAHDNDDEFVAEVIGRNRTEKNQYENLIQRIKADLKQQIKGKDIDKS